VAAQGSHFPARGAAPEVAPISRPPTAPIVPAAIPARAPACRLIEVLPTGVEANEYPLKSSGLTTIGRLGTDIVFADDPAMSDVHAVVLGGVDGFMIGDKGSAQGVFVQPSGGRSIEINAGTIIRAGQQWLVVAEQRGLMVLTRYNEAGDRLGGSSLKNGPNIIGREAPDVSIARDDMSLSRRHFALTVRPDRLELKDLGSANGTYVKIRALFRLADGDKVLVGRQVLRFEDERVKSRPAADLTVDTGAAHAEPRKEPSVRFGDGLRMHCGIGQTIIEVAERAGIRVDADCLQGVCGMDPVRIVSGGEHLNATNATEAATLKELCSLEPGPYRLACTARVMGPVVVEVVKDLARRSVR